MFTEIKKTSKYGLFNPTFFGNFFCQIPFLASLRLKRRRRKKVPKATKLEGRGARGGRALVAGPLKTELFCGFPKAIEKKEILKKTNRGRK